MRRRLAVLLSAFLMCAACSEPPQKEIDHAQGAIDAARAAGAEQYATEAFTEATSALQQAHDAVTQRDYKLALSRALDASERAQEAARNAADGKAAARSHSETAVTGTMAALDHLLARIKTAEAARVAPKDLKTVRTAAARAASALQEARAGIQSGKFTEVSSSLKTVRGEIEAQTRAVDGIIEARIARPARKRGRP
jgi:hypothetical protein